MAQAGGLGLVGGWVVEPQAGKLAAGGVVPAGRSRKPPVLRRLVLRRRELLSVYSVLLVATPVLGSGLWREGRAKLRASRQTRLTCSSYLSGAIFRKP